jgi:hypothetical protein
VRGGISRNADVLDLFKPNARCSQTVTNRFGGKTSAVLETIKAFFLNRRNQFSILDERCRSITVVGIYTENVH